MTSRYNIQNNAYTKKDKLKQETIFSLTKTWLEHAAWPSLTRKWWALDYKLLHLSGKQFGDILINSLGHTGTLSKERTISDSVPSSASSAGLANSKHRTL